MAHWPVYKRPKRAQRRPSIRLYSGVFVDGGLRIHVPVLAGAGDTGQRLSMPLNFIRVPLGWYAAFPLGLAPPVFGG